MAKEKERKKKEENTIGTHGDGSHARSTTGSGSAKKDTETPESTKDTLPGGLAQSMRSKNDKRKVSSPVRREPEGRPDRPILVLIGCCGANGALIAVSQLRENQKKRKKRKETKRTPDGFPIGSSATHRANPQSHPAMHRTAARRPRRRGQGADSDAARSWRRILTTDAVHYWVCLLAGWWAGVID